MKKNYAMVSLLVFVFLLLIVGFSHISRVASGVSLKAQVSIPVGFTCTPGVDFIIGPSATTPPAQNVAQNTTNIHFATFDVTACIKTSLSNIQFGNVISSASAYIANLRLLSNGVQVGTTVWNPTTSGSVAFYNNHSFTAGQTRTYQLYGDTRVNAVIGTKIQFYAAGMAWYPTGTSQITYKPLPAAGNIFTVAVLDKTPRIAYWYGKVNQHVDTQGNWISDPDGTSGANIDKLTYCKKWYPNTTSVESYKSETISTWRRNIQYEQNAYSWAVVTDKCVQTSPKIYLMGGLWGGVGTSDIWTFNGTNWLVAPNAPWSPRYDHGTVSLNGKSYVFGGGGFSGKLNDVWSFDGSAWKQLPNAPWTARDGMATAVLNGKIYMFGGAGNTFLNEVWSFNGTTWTKLSNAPWSQRIGFDTVTLNNKVYMFGGYDGYNFLNDSWSFDGTTWTKLSNAPWTKKISYSAVVYNAGAGNKIYVLGGYADGVDSNEVWSFDGTTWTKLSNAPWTARGQFATAVFNNKIYIFGGLAGYTNYLRDTWSYDGKTWVKLSDTPTTGRTKHRAIIQ